MKPAASEPAWMRLADGLMALALAAMVVLVFGNVVLRYGFGTGLAWGEEISRLLFVWLVFIGATSAYPRGEQMAFTGLVARFKGRALLAATLLVHLAVLVSCVLVAWGAWQQVMVGTNSKSVVLGYPMWLLPLPAFVSSLVIGVAALANLMQRRALVLGHEIPDGDYE
ncbi:MAG TPA: TRAP transporter small permease [Burkholderiaceae bacterium]|jgi:TRAP-type C4-dicarboxylate transport system permease small subunit|nr:TRAP transporter small permease [Burkholderiaceae bacterium]HPE00783.1 TRAP transporter small permease [Burkholderiaceae bacterium]